MQNGKCNYDDFFSYIIRIIKPIALDLKNALLTIPNPSNQELKLTTKLDEFFNKTLQIQKLLKENPDLIVRDILKTC